VVGAFIREAWTAVSRSWRPSRPGSWPGSGADSVVTSPRSSFADAASFYRRQGQATRATLDWLRRYAGDGQRVRVVAEQASSRRTPAEAADYLRMEAAANVVYQPFPVSVLCPYDVSVLPGDLRPGVEQSHPELLQGDRVVPSPRSPTRGSSSGTSPPWPRRR
jgi:MEDS: MEthanogen/methylotroph, DcmR Sensory domain